MKKFMSMSILALAIGSTGAFAQTAAPSTASPPISQSGAAPAAAGSMPSNTVTLSDAEAQAWIKKSAYSSDGKHVGEVTAVQRDASGSVASIELGIGGFMGLGETLVDVTPSQFKLTGDRVVLTLTAEQVKALPKAQ